MATLSKYWVGGVGWIHHFNGSVWSAQDLSGVTDYPNISINGIHTIDGKLIYAVGIRRGGSDSDPLILKSVDGGVTWVQMPTTGLPGPTQSAYLYDVHVVSATEVYIVGHIRLTTKGYVWKFDGTTVTEEHVGVAGSQYYSIYAPADNDVYIGDTDNEYRHGADFSTFGDAGAIAGWDDFDRRTLVRGSGASQVAILGSTDGAPYAMRFAAGSHVNGWTSTTMKSDFYTARETNKNIAVSTLGNAFILGRNRISGNAEVANNKGIAVVYDVLGPHSVYYSGGVALTAGGEGEVLAVYNKVTTSLVTSWFYNPNTELWVQNDTMPAVATEVFCGTSFGDVGQKGFELTGISFEIGVRPGARRIGPDRRIGG